MRVRFLSALALVTAAALSLSASAEVTTKFSGDVLYRLQYDSYTGTADNGDETPAAGDLSHRYWWNFRFGANVNENLGFSLRLSNPRGYFTDNVASTLALSGLTAVGNIVSIPEFCFKWNAGIVSLGGGIIPVGMPPVTNTVLDLVAFEASGGSPVAPGGYVNAGLTSWFVATNGTLTGLDLLLNFYKSDPIALGLELIAAMGADSLKSPNADIPKKDQLRFIAMLPVNLLSNMISVIPTMHLRTNVFRSANLEKGNHSLVGGLDVSVKPVPMLFLKTGFAAGGYSNDSQQDDPNYAANAPMGLLVNAGVGVAPGFGKGSIDFAWGNWKNRKQEPDVMSTNMLHWDIMYDFPVFSLVLRPRVRIWHTSNDLTERTTLQLRPELNFIGRF